MSTTKTYQDFFDAVEHFQVDADKMRQIVQGDNHTTVSTINGNIDSIAKTIADFKAVINDAGDGWLGAAEAAKDAAAAAQTAAESARDAANSAETNAGDSADAASGSASAANDAAGDAANARDAAQTAADRAQSVISNLDTLWSAAERAIAGVGILGHELSRQQTVRHQEGEFTLHNRGIKTGCDLSKGTTGTRTLDLAAGTCFMHGTALGVRSHTDAASVPENSSGTDATVLAYLHITGNRVQLAVTDLDQDAPDDALVLAALDVPNGSTTATAPKLEDVSVTRTARHEPEWPLMQTSPAYHEQDFAKVMGADNYQLTLDVLDYTGGEPPRLSKNAADRATNTFRTYLGGLADSVRVRWVAHLMDQ